LLRDSFCVSVRLAEREPGNPDPYRALSWVGERGVQGQTTGATRWRFRLSSTVTSQLKSREEIFMQIGHFAPVLQLMLQWGSMRQAMIARVIGGATSGRLSSDTVLNHASSPPLSRPANGDVSSITA
jgi:hypothetical protein